jgi:hypothetical protein
MHPVRTRKPLPDERSSYFIPSPIAAAATIAPVIEQNSQNNINPPIIAPTRQDMMTVRLAELILYLARVRAAVRQIKIKP